MSEKHHSTVDIWDWSDGENITDQSKTSERPSDSHYHSYTLKYTDRSYKYKNTYI